MGISSFQRGISVYRCTRVNIVWGTASGSVKMRRAHPHRRLGEADLREGDAQPRAVAFLNARQHAPDRQPPVRRPPRRQPEDIAEIGLLTLMPGVPSKPA